MAKLERKSKIEFVALGDMRVSELSQRIYRDYWVDTLLLNFDPDLIGHPVLSFRDGVYNEVDGQHRIAALKKWIGPGWESVTIECQVFQNLSEGEETEMFLCLNHVLNVGAYEKFQKAVIAGRAVENAIKKVVEQQGLNISQSKTPGAIGSVSALLTVYRRSDGQTLGRALRLIRDAFGDDGFEAAVIDGLGHLCQRYNGTLDEQTAKKRLNNVHGGVKGLLNRATTIRLKTGNTKSLCIAAAAVDIINVGKGGKKLPNWWKGGDA